MSGDAAMSSDDDRPIRPGPSSMNGNGRAAPNGNGRHENASSSLSEDDGDVPLVSSPTFIDVHGMELTLSATPYLAVSERSNKVGTTDPRRTGPEAQEGGSVLVFQRR